MADKQRWVDGTLVIETLTSQRWVDGNLVLETVVADAGVADLPPSSIQVLRAVPRASLW